MSGFWDNPIETHLIPVIKIWIVGTVFYYIYWMWYYLHRRKQKELRQ